MNTSRIRSWHTDRLTSVDVLKQKRGDTSLPDAEILLCCATSALAAQLWPGKGIDRARFTQFLVDFADPPLRVDLISTPILSTTLRLAGDLNTSLALNTAFFPGDEASILLGDKVDRTESEVLALAPAIDSKTLRGQSYAALLYSGLRSSLVHEYGLPSLLSSFSHQPDYSFPSYTNITLDSDPRQIAELAEELRTEEQSIRSWISRPVRRLHFPYEYVHQVMTSAAARAFDRWDKVTAWEAPRPTHWWVDGP